MGGENSSRALRHCRQVEKVEVQVRPAGANRCQKSALPSANVHDPPVPAHRVSPEDVGRHRRLGRSHQSRVCRNARIFCIFRVLERRIRPVTCKILPPSAPQKGNRVLQVGVKPGVVTDHLGETRIAKQRRALSAQGISLADRLHEIERGRGTEQPRHLCRPHIKRRGKLINIKWSRFQYVEKIELNAGSQHLRVNETRHHVEKSASAAMSDWPREREVGSKSLKSRI
jgi:hypothetical protein